MNDLQPTNNYPPQQDSSQLAQNMTIQPPGYTHRKQPGSHSYLGWQTVITIIILPLASLLLGLLNLWNVLDPILTDPTVPANPAEDALFDMVFDTVQYSLWIAIAVLLLVSWLFKWYRINRIITQICLTVSTIELASCAILLVLSITQYKAGIQLLSDATVVWGINIIIFTTWYWFIDGGGPQKRLEGVTTPADLFFPQQASEIPGYKDWQPHLIDYAFLAFNHNMAFSPTDTLVLSRRCKFLVTLQTTFALLAFAVALSRAIGIV